MKRSKKPRRLPDHLFKNPLPEFIQEALKNASSVDPTAPCGMSKVRTKALDETISELKRRFPQYFKG